MFYAKNTHRYFVVDVTTGQSFQTDRLWPDNLGEDSFYAELV